MWVLVGSGVKPASVFPAYLGGKSPPAALYHLFVGSNETREKRLAGGPGVRSREQRYYDIYRDTQKRPTFLACARVDIWKMAGRP